MNKNNAGCHSGRPDPAWPFAAGTLTGGALMAIVLYLFG
jgi:hypothetical protein